MRRVKKRSRKSRFERFVVPFSVVSISLYLFSAVFLHNYLVYLNIDNQKIASELKTIQNKNEELSLQIQELSSFERVNGVASADGLKTRDTSVDTVN